MKTLKDFVEAEVKKRQERRDAESKSLRDMIKALAIAPEDVESGSEDQYLRGNGIKLDGYVDEQTIELGFKEQRISDNKIHTCKVVCDAKGYSFTTEGSGKGTGLPLDEILQAVTVWYLDLKEKS